MIEQVGVVGGGTMGSGIAQICAQTGYQILLYDVNQAVLEKVLQRIEKRLKNLTEKGKLTEREKEEALNRITCVTDLTKMERCQLVIEAAPEKLDIKEGLFAQLDEICPPETVLASNTSSFSITRLAAQIQHKERVAGLHFFNPAPVMRLVEIVKGLKTSDRCIEQLIQFVRNLSKEPVVCRDTPGFLVNRIARPFYNEALKIMGEGIADVAQIDRLLKEAGQFRMGPFELQDLIGIDVNFATTLSVHGDFFGEPRFRPHPYQERMVHSGQLGRKTGGGYYRYP